MKSMYFKNLAKGLVVISAALALVNCDDSTAAANDATTDPTPVVADLTDPADPANPADPSQPGEAVTDPTQQGTGSVQTGETSTDPSVDPATDPATDPANPDVTDPASGNTGDPADPADPTVTDPSDPASQSSSSEAVASESSSSEQNVEPSSSEAKEEGGIFLATDTDENKDYMEINYIERTGDNGGAILAYPKRLSDTKKHAVVLWGPGGGTEPGAYGGIIRRLASHGFVVIATSESPDGTGRGKPALDWLENKNNTPGDPL